VRSSGSKPQQSQGDDEGPISPDDLALPATGFPAQMMHNIKVSMSSEPILKISGSDNSELVHSESDSSSKSPLKQRKETEESAIVTTVNEGDPILTVTILQSNDIPDMTQMHRETLVTPMGVIGSRRNPDGRVIIGRATPIDYNDIDLLTSQSLISRNHCAIEYRYGFPGREKWEPNYFEFLRLFTPHGEMPYFDKYLRMLVLQYIYIPSGFMIQDLGSFHGTYLKVQRPFSLLKG
jgi:hypothetical protein